MAIWTQSQAGIGKAICTSTEKVPTSPNDGVSLGANGLVVYAECDEGESFTGEGSFSGVRFGAACGWARDGNFDVTVPAWAAGSRRFVLGTWPIPVASGRVALLANGVGVTAGRITLYYE
jgi:hypothetical protein